MRIDKHLSFETLYPSIPCMQIHFLDVHLDEIENIPAFLTLILGKKSSRYFAASVFVRKPWVSVKYLTFHSALVYLVQKLQ